MRDEAHSSAGEGKEGSGKKTGVLDARRKALDFRDFLNLYPF